MTTDPTFSTLIVTYNSAGEIQDLLDDLRCLAPGQRVVVVDNASHDGTAALVRDRFPEVVLAANPDNRGYARAVNQGMDLCEGDFVFLLNPDIRVQDPGFHAALLECIRQSPSIAAVGPLQLVQQGESLRLNFTWSYWAPKAFRIYLAYLLKRPLKDRSPVRVTFLNAGCFLVRKEAFLRVGKLNEKYFLYGEEPDLFLKFKRYRYECRLHPGATVIHYRERSLKKLPLRTRWRIKLHALLNISEALLRGLASLVSSKR